MKPPSQFMMIKVDNKFIINKEFLRKDFFHTINNQNRNHFFQKYSKTEQSNIRTAWYEHMTKIKAHIIFFDYLPIYINKQTNNKYVYIYMNQKSTITWITSYNKMIETIRLPSGNLHINIPNGKIQAAPFMLQAEHPNTPTTIVETNKIIEQNNYTNKHLKTIGFQISRIETMIQKTNDEYKTKPIFTPHTIPHTQIQQLQKQTLVEIKTPGINRSRHTIFIISHNSSKGSQKQNTNKCN
ncbi:hypothetical protein CFOL_v3_14575 [Cephalotus follicularis]|uniref:DUF7588 domain-containing protein n=1 Tax=Cephalotus follicularis TaxID=3775 RepID=A0A1Q3BSX9_CEPFO|nr:hypothetical protein CFOL_v3_14575 [Cephalotus follicularis]